MGVKERLASLFGREQRFIDPFTQLIRIADGEGKFPDMSREEEKEAKRLYGSRRIAHQLRAIRELGESGRQEALDYLRRFYEVTASSENYGDGFGAVMPPIDYFYPNAKGVRLHSTVIPWSMAAKPASPRTKSALEWDEESAITV